MRLDYKTAFDKRGSAYDQAMRRFPRARWQELENVFRHVEKSRLTRVLDIPSGGGYLASHLPSNVKIHGCDPCHQFAVAEEGIQIVDLEAPELPAASYDLVVSLAAVHHIHEKSRFLECLLEAVRPTGLIVVGDVLQASPIARFLDEFVGQYNGTGHAGEYLSGVASQDFGWRPGRFEVVEQQVLPCDWTLPTVDQLVGFCRLLFNVQGATDAQILDAMHQYVGIDCSGENATLKWELFYYTFKRTP